MRIVYCTTLRLPSERAYGRQIAAVCRALAALGHGVSVLAPKRRNPISEDFWSYHGVPREVALEQLPAFDGIGSPLTPGVLGLWVHHWTFVRSLRRRLTSAEADLLYTRNAVLLPALLATGKPVVCELHALPRFLRRRFVRRCNRCASVVCLTTPMRDTLLRWGVHASLLHVAPDAVDPQAFALLPSKEEARRRLGLPADAFVVGYAGSLATMGLSKGVELLVDAVASLGDADVRALIAGGPPEETERLRARAVAAGIPAAVHLLGHVPQETVRDVYAASDVLAYPAPATRHPYFLRDTSPLKILEYMAAGRPIVCADIPPVHDLLDARSALFVPAGNAGALGDALCTLRHGGAGPQLAAQAAAAVKDRTWERRMQGILSAVA